MSVLSTREFASRPIGRLLCTALAGALFYSASAIGLNALAVGASAGLQQRLEDFQRRPKGWYTDKPPRVFFGEKPGRDPVGRGGTWTPDLLRDLARVRLFEKAEAPIAPSDLLLSLTPLPGLAAVQVDGGSGGGGGGGEGGGPGGGSGGGPGGGSEGGSQLNSNTGNRHAAYPLVSWMARGDSGVDLTLHHNSKGAYSFDLGKGWSHGYDVKIAYTSGSSAIVRYGDGLEVPYTETSGVFAPPAGIHDALVHNTGGTWTLTSKNRTKLEFDSAGRLTAVKDANSNTVTVSRDTSEKITSIIDGTGRSLTFAYTSSGLISTVTDPASRVWTFTYDSANNLTGISYPALSSAIHTRTFTYNAASDMLTETDLRGKVWTMAYDTSERLTGFTNPLGQTSTWSYSSTAATLTQPNGKTIVHNYSGGLVASVVDQAGYSTAYVYDSDRNVTSLTDKRGKVWTATFDTKGNTLTSTNPLGKTTTFTYSSGNDLLTATDPLGHTDTFTYDSNGRLLTSTDALGRTASTNTYNSYGELAATADALGRTKSLFYNSQGDVVQTTAPGGIDSFASYDVLGRATSVTDPAGNTTTVAYDEWGRAISATEPGSAVSSLAYDLESNIVSATDPLSRSGSRTYDDAGRLSSATNAKSETTAYAYNSAGYLTSVTNGRGYTRTYAYTDRGQVATLTLPDSSVEQWAYDGAGHTTAYVNPLGQTTAYGFDDAGRQTLVDYPTGLTDTTLAYDDAGRTTAMADVSGTSTWTYNVGDEVTALTTPQGSLSYTYNLAGQIATMVDSGVGTTSTAYDSAGRVTSLTDAYGDVSTYTYDTAGRLSRKDNPNGTTETYSYDNRNRPTAIVTKNAGGTTLQSRAYTFDLASQVTQVIEGGITTTYGYDAIGQLTSESKSTGYSASYTYDANGNRLTRTVGGSTESYSYDGADKLLSVTGGPDPRTFAYDAAGRRTGITRSSGTTTFSYDFESRVTSISGPGVSNSFSYNGLDTRVGMSDSTGSRSFKRNGVGVTAPVLSDGSAVFTPSGENRGGVKTTFHSALKSLDVQTSAAGAVSASRVYDAFGNDLSSSGSWASRFAYAGGFGYQQDPDTGLKLLGHRYYDSSTGRFLTRDPAKDGRNWYGYCGNSPVSSVDPSGLESVVLQGDTEFFAAWGDVLTDAAAVNPLNGLIYKALGLPSCGTGIVRKWLGVDSSVDYSAPAYFYGTLMGTVHASALVHAFSAPHVPQAATTIEPPASQSSLEPRGGSHAPYEPRSTITGRHWRMRAKEPDAGDIYGEHNIARMKRGRAPQQQTEFGCESKELHHTPRKYSEGGTTYIEVWPEEHAALDPQRFIKRR